LEPFGASGEDDDRDLATAKILLVTNPLIRREEEVKASFLRRSEQDTVA
jgi:hypothetical protein